MNDFDLVVKEFMVDYGFTATYVKASAGAYNPATGENVVTTVEVPVEAIQLDLPLSKNGIGVQTGTLIQDGDKQLYIRPPQKTNPLGPSLTIDPTSDRVRIGSVEWKIVTFKEVVVNGDDQILIELYIRH